jgi:hypothetical protein
MKISPWSRVLEMIIGPELVNNFPTFNGTRISSTLFTRAFHLALYSAKSSPHLSILHCFFEIHFNIFLHCIHSPSCGAWFSGFDTEPQYTVILYCSFVSCKEICNKIWQWQRVTLVKGFRQKVSLMYVELGKSTKFIWNKCVLILTSIIL